MSIVPYFPNLQEFCNLFFQTSKSKHMADEKDLVDEIEMDGHKNPITDRGRRRDRPLLEMGSGLEKRGIHTIST
jgi:hypothetical protein